MSNRLINALSPYLQQHAHNPVDWYPWGEEALEKAKRENKPILLSIGYAACHWCHVMAHESFDDEKTAHFMNEWFVNIKVDREERPDLDKIYQLAHQLLTPQGGGGWPLTVFMTPDDQVPFFIGTYFPVERRYNLPSFLEVMRNIQEIYYHHQANIREQNSALMEYMHKIHAPSGAKSLISAEPLKLAQQQLYERYDEQNGGFGKAPKFPQTDYLFFLLQVLPDNPIQNSTILVNTLVQMARGGIFDQVGGGFFRYTVDEKWQIPHFEKMLYDNARLILLYASVFLALNQQEFKDIILQTFHWLTREMQSEVGGFYSSLDADSEGQEGKYYLWQRDGLQKILSAQEYDVLKQYTNIEQPANFEGLWHLHLTSSLSDAQAALPTINQKLLQSRQQRSAPNCDDKILTSWNALMVMGLLPAGLILNNQEILTGAEKAFHFLMTEMYSKEQVWAVYKDGAKQTPGFLDDYVFLLRTIILFLQYQWNNQLFETALHLVNKILQLFQDPEGGFFFSSVEQKDLFFRPKTWADEALPAASAFFTHDLIKLSYLLAKPEYFVIAEKGIQNAWPHYSRQPMLYGSLSQAVMEYLDPAEIIIVRGSATELSAWQKIHFQYYQPRRWVFAIPNEVQDLPDCLADKKTHGKTVAYVCKGAACFDPISDIEEFKHVIQRSAIFIAE